MEKLRLGEYYPIASDSRGKLPHGYTATNSRVRYTGERRCPKKGEWFLSGSHIEAYYAFHDMSTEYPVGQLHYGQTVTTWVPAD